MARSVVEKYCLQLTVLNIPLCRPESDMDVVVEPFKTHNEPPPLMNNLQENNEN